MTDQTNTPSATEAAAESVAQLPPVEILATVDTTPEAPRLLPGHQFITLAELLTRRKELQNLIGGMKFDPNSAIERTQKRISPKDGTESIINSVQKVPFETFFFESTFLQEQLRTVDEVIQRTNWATPVSISASIFEGYPSTSVAPNTAALASVLLKRRQLKANLDSMNIVMTTAQFSPTLNRKPVTMTSQGVEGLDEVTAVLPKLDKADVQRNVNWISGNLRQLDAIIQRTNWSTTTQIGQTAMITSEVAVEIRNRDLLARVAAAAAKKAREEAAENAAETVA